MKTIIKENDWINAIDHGWGNGYVVLPIGHKWHGMAYSEIPVEVHYGLTFGELVTPKWLSHWPELSDEDMGCYIIGFDTCHYQDTAESCPKEFVEYETERLKEQCL